MYHSYLQQLQEALSSGPDAQKQKLAEVSRKITILRVNEKALSRRYTLMHESEAALKKVLTGNRIVGNFHKGLVFTINLFTYERFAKVKTVMYLVLYSTGMSHA